MTKYAEGKKNKYEWVDVERRRALIQRVKDGETIISASKALDINYGNAKCIVRTQRLASQKLKPGFADIPRCPRLCRLFVVEKVNNKRPTENSVCIGIEQLRSQSRMQAALELESEQDKLR